MARSSGRIGARSSRRNDPPAAENFLAFRTGDEVKEPLRGTLRLADGDGAVFVKVLVLPALRGLERRRHAVDSDWLEIGPDLEHVRGDRDDAYRRRPDIDGVLQFE